MKQVIPVVAACILKRDPLRILLHKKDESRNPELIGKWEFPGGMMKYGETPGQTLEREIREELHISIQINELLHARTNIYADGKHYLILYYACQTSYQTTPNGCEYFLAGDIFSLDCLPGTGGVVQEIILRRGYT